MNARKAVVCLWSTGAPANPEVKKDPAEYGKLALLFTGAVSPAGVGVGVAVLLGDAVTVAIAVVVVVDVRVRVTVDVAVGGAVTIGAVCANPAVAAHDSSAPSRCWVHSHDSTSVQGGL